MSKSLLPEKDYMLSELAKRLKLKESTVLKKAKKYMKEKYPDRPELAKDDRLALFMFALSNGIEFRVRTPLPAAEPKKIAELEVGQKNVEVLGYVVGIAERPTAKGTRQIIFTLVDDTGYVHTRVWGENALKMWEEVGVEEGDPILITGAVVDELQASGKTLKILGQYVEVVKLEKDEVDLPPLEEIGKAKIAELEDNTFVQIEGLVVRADVRSYVGCPECDSKLPCDVGEAVTCERCGSDVVATERQWMLLVVSDTTGDVGVRVPPGLNANVAIGDIIRVMGIYSNDIVRAISIRKVYGPESKSEEPKVIRIEEKKEEEEEERGEEKEEVEVETPEEIVEEVEEEIEEVTSEGEGEALETELTAVEQRILTVLETYGGLLQKSELFGILTDYKKDELEKTLQSMKEKGLINMDESEIWTESS